VSPDSFLLDPFLLFTDGFIIALVWERWWKGKKITRALPIGIGVVVLAIFWSCSISLWFDCAWVEPLARWCGAKSGRDWMLNSGVFHFDYVTAPSVALQAFVFVFFLSYLGWLGLGAWVGSRIRPRPVEGR